MIAGHVIYPHYHCEQPIDGDRCAWHPCLKDYQIIGPSLLHCPWLHLHQCDSQKRFAFTAALLALALLCLWVQPLLMTVFMFTVDSLALTHISKMMSQRTVMCATLGII